MSLTTSVLASCGRSAGGAAGRGERCLGSKGRLKSQGLSSFSHRIALIQTLESRNPAKQNCERQLHSLPNYRLAKIKASTF